MTRKAVVVATRDTPSAEKWGDINDDPLVFVLHEQIGAVDGVAYDWLRKQAYVAAHHQLTSDFGPGGPGAIYRLDLGTGLLSVFAQLPAGPDHHVSGPHDLDPEALPWVARTGLGDIDVDDNATHLFAMNVADRQIYRLALASGGDVISFPHGAAAEQWAANARPFGLGLHGGWLYHGVVDSREVPGLPGALAAYIYRSRLDGSEMHEVLRVGLDYQRVTMWRRWTDPSGDNEPEPAQPYVADIEFGEKDELLVGLGDRAPLLSPSAPVNGDIVLAQRVAEDRWVMTGVAGDHFTPFEAQEMPLGGLAALGGGETLVAAMEFSPRYGGLAWYSTGSGEQRQLSDGREGLYGDDVAIGDVESLCPPRPSPAYLPVATNSTCLRKSEVDVVLIMDTSTSMNRPTSDGVPKVTAANRAASDLLDVLSVEHTDARFAVIGFNDRAWIEAPLGSDEDAREALERLPAMAAEGTRLDLALSAAYTVADDRHPSERRKLWVLLLTDGLPNRVPPAEDGQATTTVLRAADRLKSTGAQVHTIGFGRADDFDARLLTLIASDSDNFHEAARADALAQLFRELAVLAGCG